MDRKQVSIRAAMRILGVKTEYALAKALQTSPQLIAYWRKEKGGFLPELWSDRMRLIELTQAQASVD